MLATEGGHDGPQDGARAGLVGGGAVDARAVELLPGVAQNVAEAKGAAAHGRVLLLDGQAGRFGMSMEDQMGKQVIDSRVSRPSRLGRAEDFVLRLTSTGQTSSERV
jgi:hypothetical protein